VLQDSANFTFNGTGPVAATTIGVGGATPSTSGSGVTFPATASISTNPNTLDDFEEGTWTPTDGSGAGLTFTIYGTTRYVKVGNMVTVSGFIGYPATASGSNATIAGLPFVSSGSLMGNQPAYNSSTLTFLNLNILDTVGNTNIKPTDRSNTQLTNAQLSSCSIYYSMTYYTPS
jgi:hypothetical protein